ncbi:MAG: ROK family protein [Anaerolineales bacterium]
MSEGPGRTGRKGTRPLVVGVDVGGTKVAAAVVKGDGEILGRVMDPTDLDSPNETLKGIAGAVSRAIQAAGCETSDISAVGLGIPGKVDPATGKGILSVNLGWRDVPVRDSLQDALRLPCAIENDVKAAALGEHRFGVGRGLRNMIYLIIGTGIEAGVIIDGRLYRGSTGMAGEIGHAVIDPRGPVCKCGGKGCLEAIASGPAILARGSSIASWVPEEGSSEGSARIRQATAGAIFDAATRGDPAAAEIVREVSKYLGLAVQWLIMAFDPQLVVLAGGVAQAGRPLLDSVRWQLAGLAEDSLVFREMFAAESIQLSELGVDAGVLGAAALAVRLSSGTGEGAADA